MTTRMRVAKIGREELERRCAEGTMYADLVPIGHWEREVDFGNVAHDYCSECHYEGKGTNFCPNCGADMRETASTKSVLDEIAGELEELEKTEPFAYGDTKIRMGVGLGIMKARKIVDNYREEGDAE